MFVDYFQHQTVWNQSLRSIRKSFSKFGLSFLFLIVKFCINNYRQIICNSDLMKMPIKEKKEKLEISVKYKNRHSESGQNFSCPLFLVLTVGSNGHPRKTQEAVMMHPQLYFTCLDRDETQ